MLPALPSLPCRLLGEPSSPPRRARSLGSGVADGVPRPVVQGLPYGNTRSLAPASTLPLLHYMVLQPQFRDTAPRPSSTLGGSNKPQDPASSEPLVLISREPRVPASSRQSEPGLGEPPGIG